MAQRIRLVGVVDNGTCYSPRVSPKTEHEISFPRLSDVTIEVRPLYPAGNKVLAGTGLTLGIRSRDDSRVKLTKTGTFANGVGRFELTPADSAKFCAGRLVYDIWLTVDGVRYQIVAPSFLKLTPNVAS